MLSLTSSAQKEEGEQGDAPNEHPAGLSVDSGVSWRVLMGDLVR
jgi:hypothetical protein